MDADVDEMETRRKQREKHKRRSTINARTDQDVIALFQHNEYLNFFKVGIVEHQPNDKREQPIYTIQTEGGPNIAEMGTEVDSLDEGYDYAVVYVNKETGKRCIRSARVLKFDSRFSSQMDVLLGKKNKPEVTYRDDAGIDKEKLVEERKTLTTSFGSSRKVKMEERGQRRKVEKETLEEMKQTAFTSNSVLANGDEVKVDHITMVKKAESSVLPPAVSDANFPNDIYPTSLFVSEEEVAELGQLGMEFLQTADKKKLKSQGFPICVLQSWNSLPFADPTSDPQKAALLVLLATQVSFLSILCKGHGASITRAEVDSFPYPQPFVDKVKAQYMPSDYDRGSHNRGVARLRLSPTEKDRMMAYTLALALGISHQNIIGINSWHKSTNFPITKLEKMLEALGCDIFVFDTEQAYRHDSLRGARLLRPPSNEAKKIRKRRR